MMTNNTKLSFAKAMYRVLSAARKEETGANPPTFKEAEEELLRHIEAYIVFPGNLPYNGFDVVEYFTKRGAERGFPGTPPKDIQVFMNQQQTMLEELARVWMEMSNTKDATHPVH